MMTDTGNVQIIRERMWITHFSGSEPERRVIAKEYTLYNPTDRDIGYLLLDTDEFFLGLRIFDSDGEELAFFPKHFLSRLLEKYLESQSLESAEKSNIQRTLSVLKTQGRYFLLIQLPYDRPFRPGTIRLIKLQYFDPQRLRSISRMVGLFNTPRYQVKKEKSDEEDYDTFFFIQAPLGYKIRYKKEYAKMNSGKQITNKDGFYENIYEEVVNIRLPPTNGRSFSFRALYEVVPPTSERLFVRLTIWSLISMGAIMLILGIIPFLRNFCVLHVCVFQSLVKVYREFTAGIASASLLIAGLIRDPLMRRTRFYYLLAGIIAIISYLIFS